MEMAPLKMKMRGVFTVVYRPRKKIVSKVAWFAKLYQT